MYDDSNNCSYDGNHFHNAFKPNFELSSPGIRDRFGSRSPSYHYEPSLRSNLVDKHPLRTDDVRKFNGISQGIDKDLCENERVYGCDDQNVVFTDYVRKYGAPRKSSCHKDSHFDARVFQSVGRDLSHGRFSSTDYGMYGSLNRIPLEKTEFVDQVSSQSSDYVEDNQINVIHLDPTRSFNVNPGALLNDGKKYGGSAVEFTGWKRKTLYIEQVETSKMPPNVACDYLLSQTEGKVREYAISISHTHFGKLWTLIKEILKRIEQRYAQPHQIADELAEKLSSFPGVKTDCSNLEEFILILQTIENHKSRCRDIDDFDTREGV